MISVKHDVCNDLLSLVNCVKAATMKLAEQHRLTHMQLFALYAIDQRGELAMGQVADTLHCDASNVTGIVDRLVVQGLLTREECVRDRRAKTLRITEQGRHLLDELNDLLPVTLGCDRLTDSERQALRGIVGKLCN